MDLERSRLLVLVEYRTLWHLAALHKGSLWPSKEMMPASCVFLVLSDWRYIRLTEPSIILSIINPNTNPRQVIVDTPNTTDSEVSV
jgi:hypothetical protein